MKTLIWIALPCFLGADPPLTLEDVLSKSRVPIERLNVYASLAEVSRQIKDASGLLRESPSVSVSAGPRTNSVTPTTTDQTVEIDAPLLLNRRPARQLASSLDSATPLVYTATDLENRLSIQKAFLDTWLAEQIEAIRSEDKTQVNNWLEIARIRSESGADPAFQLELVKGEFVKSHLDWEEAKRAHLQAWNILKSLADLPTSPQSLVYNQGKNIVQKGELRALELESSYQNGVLRRSAIARQSIELNQINLQAAISNSRWSISGSHTKESDDRITKIGIAYKFPRSGEMSAIKAEQRSRTEVTKRNTELELSELDLRFASALQTIESSAHYPDIPDTTTSIDALTMRLKEGKDQPSDVIPMRRQFLEIRIAELLRQYSLYLAYAELQTLTAGNI
ncbi:MAG: TolC family protein [Holophagaceae bacterium]|nr:TolC family protein [Holophagaceae bacterium]